LAGGTAGRRSIGAPYGHHGGGGEIGLSLTLHLVRSKIMGGKTLDREYGFYTRVIGTVKNILRMEGVAG